MGKATRTRKHRRERPARAEQRRPEMPAGMQEALAVHEAVCTGCTLTANAMVLPDGRTPWWEIVSDGQVIAWGTE